MKLALFEAAGQGEASPGLLTERGVVDVSVAVRRSHTHRPSRGGLNGDAVLRPAAGKMPALSEFGICGK
jgi:hypothetical protein